MLFSCLSSLWVWNEYPNQPVMSVGILFFFSSDVKSNVSKLLRIEVGKLSNFILRASCVGTRAVIHICVCKREHIELLHHEEQTNRSACLCIILIEFFFFLMAGTKITRISINGFFGRLRSEVKARAYSSVFSLSLCLSSSTFSHIFFPLGSTIFYLHFCLHFISSFSYFPILISFCLSFSLFLSLSYILFIPSTSYFFLSTLFL